MSTLSACWNRGELAIARLQNCGRNSSAMSYACYDETKRTAILAGDLNVRAWEAARAKIGDDGGAHWHDAWHTAGANPAAASTWRRHRFDRILYNTPSEH